MSEGEGVRLVFFSSVKHFPVLPIANSCPAVPAAASRVAMSTEAVIPCVVRERSAFLGAPGWRRRDVPRARLMLTPNRGIFW